MNKIKLFCFPYAGGSAIIYSKWNQYLKDFIEIYPVELAGRGKRINEPLYTNYDEMIEDVFGIIYPEIALGHYAIFGHSMGALLAFSLTHYISQKNINLPIHLFLSGQEAPHLKMNNSVKKHKLSEEGFLSEVIKMGGIPDELISNKELLDFYLPILRNDFMLDETYEHQTSIALDTNVSILAGLNDELIKEELTAWNEYSKRTCNIQYFKGNHFFIEQNRDLVISYINDVLLREKWIRRID